MSPCGVSVPVSCVNGHFPWAFTWDIPLSLPSSSSPSIFCTVFFPRPSYILVQCPSPKAAQGVMYEMSSNNRLASILPVSKTAKTRWICCVICSYLLRPLCQKWKTKNQIPTLSFNSVSNAISFQFLGWFMSAQSLFLPESFGEKW